MGKDGGAWRITRSAARSASRSIGSDGSLTFSLGRTAGVFFFGCSAAARFAVAAEAAPLRAISGAKPAMSAGPGPGQPQVHRAARHHLFAGLRLLSGDATLL